MREIPLIEAVRRDLTRLRAELGGTSRHFAQRDLEQIFFQDAQGTAPRPLAQITADLEATIGKQPLAGEVLAELEASHRQGTPPGAVFGPILERLAFDTQCDLDRVQILLWEHRAALETCAREETIGTQEETTLPAPTQERLEVRPEVLAPEPFARSAVEAFESGRARGEDLGTLFDQLEKDLGLEAGSSAVPEGGDALEPEVMGESLGVGSILAEYLWDQDRVGQPVPRAEQALIERFARFIDASEIRPDNIEYLEEAHLRAFLVRELPRVLRGGDPEVPWRALQHFLTWCDAEQSTDLEARFATLREEYGPGLERLRRLWNWNAENSPGAPGDTQWFRIDELSQEGQAQVEWLTRLREGTSAVQVPAPLAANLQAGDILLGSIDGGTLVQVEQAYLQDAEALLRSPSWGVPELIATDGGAGRGDDPGSRAAFN